MKLSLVYLLIVVFGNALFWLSVAFQPLSSRDTTGQSMQRLMSTTKGAGTELLSDSTESKSRTHTCRFCNATFASRNALFRHVRSDPTCSTLANNGTPLLHLTEPKRHKIALQFQYFSTDPLVNDTESLDCNEAEVAGKVLQRAVQEAIGNIVEQQHRMKKQVELKSTTQSSIANLRHSSLAQESNCAAAADVMIMSFDAPAAISCTCTSEGTKEDPTRQQEFLTKLVETANQILQQDSSSSCGLTVTLSACKLLSSDSKLHAERSCTQRIYHYLMPIDWLPGGNDLAKWWIESEQHEKLSDHDAANHHESRVSTRPPNDSLLQLKKALKSAESNSTASTDNSLQTASGRFGTLANKVKRPWHNFADPNLRGDASPNNEPVWRVVDRARLVQLVTATNEQVFCVLEFRGNDFLPQQVRRMVGTVIAMANGWLPSNAIDMLTQSHVLIQAPLAPARHLYLDSVRFHFEELRMSGQGIFDNEVDGVIARYLNQSESVEELMLRYLSRGSVQETDDLWLQQLRDEIAPGIQQKLESLSQDTDSSFLEAQTDQLSSPAPSCYGNTLKLLRTIVASGDWPTTSAARSNVIRELSDKRGSFTVVNPRIYRNDDHPGPLPLGNSLFPDLAEAVFDLELSLSKQDVDCATADGIETNQSGSRRPASSHCAINCNAEFTPHVDSGRGAGQSLSMICGLGDYVGGELAVEGPSHDIRYRPLEFDGWKLRHWTLPFAGERFSLVWFTPEGKGKE